MTAHQILRLEPAVWSSVKTPLVDKPCPTWRTVCRCGWTSPAAARNLAAVHGVRHVMAEAGVAA